MAQACPLGRSWVPLGFARSRRTLEKSMRIAGKHTDQQWMALKRRLQSKPSRYLWDSAFRRFYRMRIDTRYLHPIASIERLDTQRGEGFAIATLFCSLIEFLESCERGDNFHFIGRTGTLQSHEYSERQASSYFKDFLKTRKPFDTLIPSTLVNSFYQDVRCGLFHEARTKGSWFMSTAASHGGTLISQEGGRFTLFRNQLIPTLETYFLEYQERLLTNRSTQQAFIRKFDHLCKA